MQKNTKQASTLRIFRKIHRTSAGLLFFFFFIMATTGLLLGLKKNSAGLIQSKSQLGTSSDLKKWLPLDSLHSLACKNLHDSVSKDLSLELDRIDVRKNKGMIKFIFTDSFWAIQLDGATGKLLHIERRRSDFIEKLHDGSILDYYLGTSGDIIKVIYSSLMGIALLIFTITGFWLWYKPQKALRHKKNALANTQNNTGSS